MPDLVVILKWAGASGAAPAWAGVTAFMVTKRQRDEFLPAQAERLERIMRDFT